jgi:hypothetical protein
MGKQVPAKLKSEPEPAPEPQRKLVGDVIFIEKQNIS